jgi:hypothetical protein
MYQYCSNEYDQLRVSKLWRTGGTKNTTWTEKYANKNLYADLGFSWPGNGTAANALKPVLHAFADSFGECDWYIDSED